VVDVVEEPAEGVGVDLTLHQACAASKAAAVIPSSGRVRVVNLRATSSTSTGGPRSGRPSSGTSQRRSRAATNP